MSGPTRLPSIALVLALVAVGCSGEPGGAADQTSTRPAVSPTTTTAASPPSTSTTKPATTVTEPATTTTTVTTTVPLPQPLPALLVAGSQGLFLEMGGTVTPLVEGLVSYAVDDTRGGVLFQVDRGRFWPGEESPLDSTVWWVPAGSAAARDLLVADPPAQLTLHDAVPLDGDVAILYTRSQGWSPSDAVDRLRRFSLDERVVTEILSQGAWEAGYGGVLSGGDLISMTEYGQVESRCRMIDFSGDPVSLSAAPEGQGCEEPDCPWGCAVSPSGSRYGYVLTSEDAAAGYDVVVRSTSDGVELLRFHLDDADGYPVELDLQGAAVLVNRFGPEREPLPALVVVAGPGAIAVSQTATAGTARFVTSEPDLPAPVASPVARAIVLRSDGLGAVTFGTPVGPALHVLTGLLGEPSIDDLQTGPWTSGGPGSCFAATGYGCDDYFRWVTWEQSGIGVTFTDGAVFRNDGVPHLSSWVAVPTLAGTLPLTGAGIAVGASVDDLRAAYGEDLSLSAQPDECEGSWTFSVFGRLITIESPHIRGTLSGPPEDPGTRVRSMAAGQGSSC